MWRKYTSLERVRRLRNEGRELLGQRILATEKRDGENTSLWLDENREVRISSHNLEDAAKDIQSRMKATPEYPKVVDLLNDEYQGNIIVYGELIKKVSPTRIERRKKYVHWVLFDVYDVDAGRYMPYNWIYQLAYHYKIPIVRIVDEFIPMSEGELFGKIEEAKKWCKRHCREGVVLKDYKNQVFAKEKIDLPKRPKLKQTQTRPEYPPMPEETIIRALMHALDEVGEENWKDKAKAMPVVARHVATEAREHNYNMPRNIYSYYVNMPLETIKAKTINSQQLRNDPK